MTILRAGAASDVGRVRRNNQDQFLLEEPLFAVADGMGGAAGGEEASLTAVSALKAAFQAHPTANGLADGVRDANRAVWEKALKHPELRGMGTTMTAVALVEGEDDEDVLAVANVGDSRVYLLRDGRLDQITDDHSVPEELVRAGRITPEEAATHPQRNMLTRVLGNEPEVEVDCFAIIPYSGDRLVLASDGLFNEVDHEGITAVARRQRDPEEAASELVRMARESGGNDNITVVVVDVVDDGDRAARASAAVASTPPPPPRSDPSVPPDTRPPAAAAIDATVARRPAAAVPGPTVGGTAGAPPSVGDVPAGNAGHWASPRPAPPPEAPELPLPSSAAPAATSGPGLSLRGAAFLAALLLVVVGSGAAIGFFARGGFFVGVEGGEVVVFRGRPGGLLWFEPTVADRTGITLSELSPATLEELKAGKEEPSLGAARGYVSRIRQTAAPTTTTTLPPAAVPTSAATAPSVSTTP